MYVLFSQFNLQLMLQIMHVVFALGTLFMQQLSDFFVGIGL